MASELETKRLLEGIVAGNPFQAFGLSPMSPSAQLRRDVRQRQASFHQDSGNPSSISQLANGCADVICSFVTEMVACEAGQFKRNKQRTNKNETQQFKRKQPNKYKKTQKIKRNKQTIIS